MNGVLVYVIGWFKSAINDTIWLGYLLYVIWFNKNGVLLYVIEWFIL